MTARPVVFSGMRPTGRLHLGNYWGALRKWVELTEANDCFYSVVDWHMLTTGYEDTSRLQDDAREMVLDWLAAGLDPNKCVMFKQSAVPEHAELALLLGMVTPLSWLENNPTWKEQLQELAKTKHSQAVQKSRQTAQVRGIEEAQARWEGEGGSPAVNAAPLSPGEDIDLSGKDALRTFGFLGYPVLQAADILLYRGTKVPVGQDQLPHLELCREIARRFNSIFGGVFPEPQPVLTPTPKVPGLDGRKMSKSYGNTLDIFETADSLKKKTGSAYTDPNKVRKDDKGHPLPCPENPPGCTVFALHQLYGEKGFVSKREKECKDGAVGCVACKKDLLGEMEPAYAKFREARQRYAAKSGLVDEILEQGARKARTVAQRTMAEARRAVRVS